MWKRQPKDLTHMLTRKTILLAIVSLVATLAAAPAAIAQPGPSAAFQRAILEGLSPETRADIERRATAGNSVYEVARVTLLNNMQLANLIKPDEPPLSSVVAIDSSARMQFSSRVIACVSFRSMPTPYDSSSDDPRGGTTAALITHTLRVTRIRLVCWTAA
jgi:hypothetical protein